MHDGGVGVDLNQPQFELLINHEVEPVELEVKGLVFMLVGA